MEIAPGDQAAPSVLSRGVRDDAAVVVVMRHAGRRSDRGVGGRTSQKCDRGARARDVAAVARDASADPTAARSGSARTTGAGRRGGSPVPRGGGGGDGRAPDDQTYSGGSGERPRVRSGG
jgi:hypothetical protein